MPRRLSFAIFSSGRIFRLDENGFGGSEHKVEHLFEADILGVSDSKFQSRVTLTVIYTRDCDLSSVYGHGQDDGWLLAHCSALKNTREES